MAYTPRTIGSSVGRLARPALKARGFAAADILAKWRVVVGDTLADRTAPERLVWPTGRSDGAVLKLRVAPGFAPEVQHLAPLIVERINTFYGYKAIARLGLSQGPLPKPPAPPRSPPRPLDPEEQARLDGLLGEIQDAGLRASLARLGHGLIADK
jgi:hypothetical protein